MTQAFRDNPYIGQQRLLKPNTARRLLDIGPETFGRVRPALHRLEVGRRLTLVPLAYLSGYLDWHTTPERQPSSARAALPQFAQTETARELMNDEEALFDQGVQALLEHGHSGENFISAAGIASVLNANANVIRRWVDESPGHQARNMTETAFWQLCRWARPELPPAA